MTFTTTINAANAKAAARAFAYADHITAKREALAADEWDSWIEFPTYAKVLAFEHAYSTSFFVMEDGTICAIHDNGDTMWRYLVDWRKW